MSAPRIEWEVVELTPETVLWGEIARVLIDAWPHAAGWRISLTTHNIMELVKAAEL
jgi:hypothetical protein